MLVVTFQVKAVPGTEIEIKEAIALHCDPLGEITFPKIDQLDTDMILTAYIEAPDGSVAAFNKQIRPFLKRFRDTLIMGVREVLPEQMEL